MSVQLVTYNSDRRLELGAAEAVRKPIYGDDWNVIRIGLQFSLNGVASNITSTPRFAFGVCHGNANVLVSSSADHLVGYRSSHATWTHTAGTPSYFNLSTHVAKILKKVNTTETEASTSTAVRYYMNHTDYRCGVFFELNKSAGTGYFCFPASAGITSDMTDEQFKNIMELASLADIATVKAGYTPQTFSGVTIDEATNGELDHIFVYWDRSSHLLSFNLRHRRIS